MGKIIKSFFINMETLVQSLKRCKVNGNVLSLPPISEGILENYQDVRKALLNAGAEYKRNTFVFPSEAQPFIDRLCEGKSVNIKKEFQFFPTPADIAEWLVELAELKEEDEILEPSAGQGAIVKAIHDATWQARTVFGYELMSENRTVLEKIVGFRLLGNDFLECDTSFDKIIANPPFNKNQDIDHIRKMYECLRPKGRIVSVASKHWQISSNKKERDFKNWLNELDADVYEIERGRLKKSGTMISCCVIVINH